MSKARSVGLVVLGVFVGITGSIGLNAIASRDARVTLPLEEVRQFTDVFGAVKSNYVEPVEDKKLIAGAISGMLSDLDPHSAYLDADAFKELQTATQGEFGGLGIEVGSEDGFVKVIAPIEDTPAARAGVKAGDLIIKIDDRSTKGLVLNDAVKLMRGKPQTLIVLTILRKNEAQPIVIKIMRDIIKVQSVRSKELEPGIAYLRITNFQEQTGPDLVKHINRLNEKALANKHPIKSLVLDLRNDPGGLLYSAIAVSAAFLPKDTLVVSTDGRAPDSKRRFEASPNDYLRGLYADEDYLKKLPAWVKTVPMVVLINAGSASASEIVAGALQDHKRATVLGTQSFGKGSVQTILPLSRDTAIKLTTARYYTPNGRSIQAKGIVPDLKVTETAEGDIFDRPREIDLDKHLINDKEPEAKPPSNSALEPGANLESNQKNSSKAESISSLNGGASTPNNSRNSTRKPIEFGSADDFQLQQAINKLQGKTVQIAKVKPVAAIEASAVEKTNQEKTKAFENKTKEPVEIKPNRIDTPASSAK